MARVCVEINRKRKNLHNPYEMTGKENKKSWVFMKRGLHRVRMVQLFFVSTAFILINLFY